MTRTTERELEKLLDVGPVPEPPAGLAARIAAEIPEEVDLHPDLAREDDAVVVPLRRRRSTWYAAAAAVLTLSLTAAVTWQLRQTAPEVATVDADAGREIRPAPAPAADPAAEAPAPPGRLKTVEGDDAGDLRTRIRSQLRRIDQAPRSEAPAGDEAAVPGAPAEAGAPAPRETAASGDRDDANEGSLSLGLVNGSAAAKGEGSPGPSGSDVLGREAREETESFRDAIEVTAEAPVVSVTSTVTGERLFQKAATPQDGVSEEVGTRAAARRDSEVGHRQGDPARANRYVVDGLDATAVEITAPPSTGGTAEPNDAPYGDVFFADAGVNPFVDTGDDPLSTFGLEVDTGSYTVVRRFLRDGHLPPPQAVRVEELVNAFDYGDRPPRRGDFRLSAEGAPTPFTINDDYRLVRFAVAAREVDAADRPPATLVFVVDVSGSMDRENRLGLVRAALDELLDELRHDDRVGLVVYGSRGDVLLEPTSDLERVRRAIGRLRAGGSTNAEEGLVLGYELAADHLERGRITRVILCSDGVANVGRTGPESILERIRRDVDRGIELTAVGFGMGNYNDVLMERLADTGDGRYAYVDTLPEARRIFVEELTGTLYTVARDTKAQVEFDPAAVSRWRLLGYENRDIADDRFRDPTVDAGEIGAGHTVTALYEVKLADGARARDTLATLRVRYRPADSDRPVELEQQLEVGDLAPSWRAASPALRLATIVAEYAELLKRSFWARDGSMSAVLAELQRLQPEFAGDGRVADLASLVAAARDLMEEEAPRDRDADE